MTYPSESERSAVPFVDWLGKALDSGRVDAGDFARSAIGELPRIQGPRAPCFNAWPKDVREEMRAIWEGQDTPEEGGVER